VFKIFPIAVKTVSKDPVESGVEGVEVVYADAATLTGRLRVKSGTGNAVSLGQNTKFRGNITIQGNDNRIVFGENVDYKGQVLIKGNGQLVEIGDHTTAADVYILCQEQCDVRIGRHCMLSREIEIRTTDAHSVVSRSTGERLNTAASIDIRDHVWISLGTVLSKGTFIAEDNIVGAMAFVSGSFEESGTIIAGVPAKVVKRDVTWDRRRKKKYTMQELSHWRR
jgi:acetyltransferase-like isoleucine patch superfamily enzyme